MRCRAGARRGSAASPTPPNRATPASAFTGPGRHHGCPPVRPSSLGPDQGHTRSTPSGEAEPGASWFGDRMTLGHHIPLPYVRAAETTLVSVLSPLEDSGGLGSRLSVMPALRGVGSTSGARCSPCSAPVQSGLPVGTFSCSTRDGLLSEHNHSLTNFGAGEWRAPVETVDDPVDKQ